jgi:predicted MFS family arabinose efflux permease
VIKKEFGLKGAAAFQPILLVYSAIGAGLLVGFHFLSPAIESSNTKTTNRDNTFLGLHRSKRTVFKLSLLFALDAFAGALVIQSVIAYWFHLRFQLDPSHIGAIFLFANIFAGISALAAGWLARRIGLINTMIFTHLPSNILLILVPLMPNVYLAILVLLLRFSISQMDVPTRQAYTMEVVSPDERSAAAGITAVARSIGATLSPMLGTMMISNSTWMSVPFFIAGGLKIVYDILLYQAFVNRKSDS